MKVPLLRTEDFRIWKQCYFSKQIGDFDAAVVNEESMVLSVIVKSNKNGFDRKNWIVL